MRLIYYFNTWSIIWHGNAPVFLKICTDLQEVCGIWAQDGSETITKTILSSCVAHFLQIFANLQKSWNNMMSNDGWMIKNMDLSHNHLAVRFKTKLYKKNWKKREHSILPRLFLSCQPALVLRLDFMIDKRIMTFSVGFLSALRIYALFSFFFVTLFFS